MVAMWVCLEEIHVYVGVSLRKFMVVIYLEMVGVL